MKKILLMAGIAMMFAACNEEKIEGPGAGGSGSGSSSEEITPGVFKLTERSGAEQSGRIENIPVTKSSKWQRLNRVVEIGAPESRKDENWSATAVCFSPYNQAFVSWHSDKQAKENINNDDFNWGGAIDELQETGTVIKESEYPALPDLFPPTLGAPTKVELTKTLLSSNLKFNNIWYTSLSYNMLLLSATSYEYGGAIGTIDVFGNPSIMSVLPFPGNSVNAAINCPESAVWLAISGAEKGVFAIFDATFTPDLINYKALDPDKNYVTGGVASNRQFISPFVCDPQPDEQTGYVENYGGKYITVYGNKVYVLREKIDENVAVIDVYEGYDYGFYVDFRTVVHTRTISLGTNLVAPDKDAENYTEEGGWTMTGKERDYYGKHVLAVREFNGKMYAFVGMGGTKENKRGLFVVDIDAETVIQQIKTGTTGVCVFEDYIFTAGGAGLRVYTQKEDGTLELYAQEVNEYDENGKPIENEVPEKVNANFVAAHRTGYNELYVYVTYGQSGVKVFHLAEETDEAAE